MPNLTPPKYKPDLFENCIGWQGILAGPVMIGGLFISVIVGAFPQIYAGKMRLTRFAIIGSLLAAIGLWGALLRCSEMVCNWNRERKKIK
jgi:hypothetical protein